MKVWFWNLYWGDFVFEVIYFCLLVLVGYFMMEVIGYSDFYIWCFMVMYNIGVIYLYLFMFVGLLFIFW